MGRASPFPPQVSWLIGGGRRSGSFCDSADRDGIGWPSAAVGADADTLTAHLAIEQPHVARPIPKHLRITEDDCGFPLTAILLYPLRA